MEETKNIRAAAARAERGAGEIAEIQGLYGPFSFPEKLLQQIWARREFDVAHASTCDGVRVEVLHPGRWNHLGGPDFKDARLRLGGKDVIGDVEVHLRASDWAAHGHRRDPAYNGVVLHVVLFPPEPAEVTIGANGAALPTLVLLPLLHHDLEEYAADDAVAQLADHPLARAQSALAGLGATELERVLREHSLARWRQKVRFARLRIERLGWDGACHQTALEILGYRYNRAAMLAVAAAYPLAAWQSASGDGAWAQRVYAEFDGRWSTQGVRPANQPRARLRQYAAWTTARPNWPKDLRAWAAHLPAWEQQPGESVGAARRRLRLRQGSAELAGQVSGSAVGGTRFDNLVCDGFLPLLAAERHDDAERLFELWRVWLTGDLPQKLTRLLRELGVADGHANPLCHGAAQGLLGWMLAEEQRFSPSAGAGA